MSIIEKLKDKKRVRAFGLMSPEEQECYWRVGSQNCLKYNGVGGSGTGWIEIQEEVSFYYDNQTYAIKPDYQPEPEFEDYEIKLHLAPVYNTTRVVEMLCVRIDERTAYQLHELPSLPNFEGFWDKEDDLNLPNSPIHLCIVCVSKRINEGKTVYARLRRDT
jgi:hypothetical protein